MAVIVGEEGLVGEKSTTFTAVRTQECAFQPAAAEGTERPDGAPSIPSLQINFTHFCFDISYHHPLNCQNLQFDSEKINRDLRKWLTTPQMEEKSL